MSSAYNAIHDANPDPAVFPCAACRAPGPDCRNECREMEAHLAWKDRQRLIAAADALMGIFGYTRCDVSNSQTGKAAE